MLKLSKQEIKLCLLTVTVCLIFLILTLFVFPENAKSIEPRKSIFSSQLKPMESETGKKVVT